MELGESLTSEGEVGINCRTRTTSNDAAATTSNGRTRRRDAADGGEGGMGLGGVVRITVPIRERTSL